MVTQSKEIYSPDTNVFILAASEIEEKRAKLSKIYFSKVEEKPEGTRLLRTVQNELMYWINGLGPTLKDFFARYNDVDLIDDFFSRCKNNKLMEAKDKKYKRYSNIIKNLTENEIEVSGEKISEYVQKIKDNINHYLFIFQQKSIIDLPQFFDPALHNIPVNDPEDAKHIYLISVFLKNNPLIAVFSFITWDKQDLFYSRDAIQKWNPKIRIITPETKGSLC